MSNARLYAAIEMACLDIQGKVLGRPMSDLLGGSVRSEVPFIAYLFWRYDRRAAVMIRLPKIWPIIAKNCTKHWALMP